MDFRWMLWVALDDFDLSSHRTTVLIQNDGCTGYSGSDMKNLVKEASMGPLREALMQGRDIGNISKDEMRPISVQVSSALLNTISLLSCSLDAIILPTRVFLSLLLEDA